ncbi:hypothetical protein [Shinella sp.]|uniref:hypothetical protein n=2 Tax=Shinella sp. TaxID=1870904 RepID=UPI0040368FE5
MLASHFSSPALLLCAGIIGSAMSFTSSVSAQEPISLFKIITVKDEIVVGLTVADIAELKGNTAGAIGKALATDRELSLWQFAVRKGADGSLEEAPLRRVSILGHNSLRVEPYATPLRIVPAE